MADPDIPEILLREAMRSAPGEVKTAQAFTVTVDVDNFSLQPVDTQFEWYVGLKRIMEANLERLGLTIAPDIDGDVFWSPGGDGGTLSVVRGGAAAAVEFAIHTAAAVQKRSEKKETADRFQVTIGLDLGLVHIGRDLNGSPNVWGEAINNSNRISAACDPGQILASEEFVRVLQSQTPRFQEWVGLTQSRLAKHGRFFRVVNLYSRADGIGRSISPDASIHIADFEAPYREMANGYRAHLQEVVRAGSGVWTLLLSRRLYDMGEISEADFNYWVGSVSTHGAARDGAAPRHPLFSSFGENALCTMMHEGRFVRLSDRDVLCQRGDLGEDLYIVARGRLNVRVGSMVVASRETGSVVGEMALIEPGAIRLREDDLERTAAMVADGDVTVFAIPYASVRKAARTSAEVASTLVRFYRERRKENARRGAGCLNGLDDERARRMMALGRVEGVLPRQGLDVCPETECLIVCCLGEVTIKRGAQRVTLREVDDTMGAVWVSSPVPSRSNALTLRSRCASEVVLWEGRLWREWLRDTRNGGLSVRLAETSNERL